MNNNDKPEEDKIRERDAQIKRSSNEIRETAFTGFENGQQFLHGIQIWKSK